MTTTLPSIPPLTLSTSEAVVLARVGSHAYGDGYQLKLISEGDNHSHINDYDCYGKIAWGGSVRPHEFDGSAEVIKRSGDGRLWWLPYREGHKVFTDCRATVIEIAEYGFQCYGLELWGPALDARDCLHTTRLQSVWRCGIEPVLTDTEIASGVIEELLASLRDELITSA